MGFWGQDIKPDSRHNIWLEHLNGLSISILRQETGFKCFQLAWVKWLQSRLLVVNR